MIDLHAHILPNVDDGAKSMAESIQILKRFCAEGYQTVLATPHIFECRVPKTQAGILTAYEKLQESIRLENLDIEILLGAELFISTDLPEALRQNNFFTINQQSRYALIELPMHEFPMFTHHVIETLLFQGITPIVAHPERYAMLEDHIDCLSDWIQKGVLMQLNTGSLTGFYGNRVQKVAINLIRHGYIHIIATDTHSSLRRRPGLDKGVQAASKFIGHRQAMDMVTTTPRLVIEGQKVSVPAPKKIKQNIFKRWFKG